MDQFIKCVITNKLSDIESIIHSEEISIEDYHKLYHYFLYFYTKGKISDNILYLLSYLLVGKYKIVHIHHIYSFKEILEWHITNKKNMNNTFMALNIYNNIHTIKHRIKGTINFLKSNSKNMSKLIGKHKKTSTIKKIIKEHFLEYISYIDDKIMQNNIMLAHTQANVKEIHENEIYIRLRMICNHFGIQLLQKMGVDIIDNNYFSMLKFDEKIEYYKKCINIIVNTGKNMYGLMEIKKKTNRIKKRIKNDYNKYKETLKNE